MFSPSRAIPVSDRSSFLWGAIVLATVLFAFTFAQAQSRAGANTTGTFGNEVIQGKIFFPAGHRSVNRPVVKLRGDSTSELTAFASLDGDFSFTRLRPDSYTITVEGGDEFENAYETVVVGSAGAVPAQGNPFDYAIPVIYQVQIYLRPKSASAARSAAAATGAIPAEVPKVARDLFNKAIEAERAGERAKAVEQFKAAIVKAPHFGLAYNELGVQYLKLGQADKAAEAFAEAVRLAPDDFTSNLNYGIALWNLKKFAEAEKPLRQAVQKNPAAPAGHYYLALALLGIQQLDAAAAEFDISIKNSSDRIAQAHRYLGGIYWHNKEYKRAAEELERYIALDPKAPDTEKTRATIKDLRSRP